MALNRDHPVMPPPPSASGTSFPILAISILGIITTAIFLVSYYVFVIKCCLNWHQYEVIRRLSRFQRWRENPNRRQSASIYSSTAIHRGLDESVIRAIPTFQFQRGSEKQCSFHECAVCLNEFQGEERIRLLPNCFHVFHIDCIDTWLQTHASCPLCRAEITSTIPIPVVKLNLDEGRSVTIDVRDERTTSTVNPAATDTNNSSGGRKERKLHKMSSMGDEYINVAGKDEEFGVQPMRRSLSMGSSSDRKMYMAVQEILRQNPHFQEEGTSGGGSERSRRPFFQSKIGDVITSLSSDFVRIPL